MPCRIAGKVDRRYRYTFALLDPVRARGPRLGLAIRALEEGLKPEKEKRRKKRDVQKRC